MVSSVLAKHKRQMVGWFITHDLSTQTKLPGPSKNVLKTRVSYDAMNSYPEWGTASISAFKAARISLHLESCTNRKDYFCMGTSLTRALCGPAPTKHICVVIAGIPAAGKTTSILQLCQITNLCRRQQRSGAAGRCSPGISGLSGGRIFP